MLIVTELGISEVDPSQATIDSIGQKALGLLTIPADWTKPFFSSWLDQACCVVAHSKEQLQAWLDEACERSGVKSNNVMIRSNGVEEGLLQRGALTSSVSVCSTHSSPNVVQSHARLHLKSQPHLLIG